MLRMYSTNINYSASSIINNDAIASFSASVNGSNDNVSLNVSIATLNDLVTSAATIKSDLEDFIDYITNANSN